MIDEFAAGVAALTGPALCKLQIKSGGVLRTLVGDYFANCIANWACEGQPLETDHDVGFEQEFAPGQGRADYWPRPATMTQTVRKMIIRSVLNHSHGFDRASA